MFPAARGLSFSFRPSLRPSGWLLASRSPLIPGSPSTLKSCQFSSTRLRNANYVRFEVDPEQPLNYRRWSTGTQVFGGIVVLSVVYYVSQYVPSFLTHLVRPTTFLMYTVLRLYQKRADGDLWMLVRNLRPGCVWIMNMNHATNIPSDGEGVS